MASLAFNSMEGENKTGMLSYLYLPYFQFLTLITSHTTVRIYPSYFISYPIILKDNVIRQHFLN
jgi:hypothetical protein